MQKGRFFSWSSSVLVLLAVACGGDTFTTSSDGGGDGDSPVGEGGNPADSGPADSGPADTGPSDAGPGDSGPGCTCVPPAPMGWTFGVLDGDARDPCPSSYDTPVDLLEGVSASPAQCGCTCPGVDVQPTCAAPQQATLQMGDSQCQGPTPVTLNNVAACNVQSAEAYGNGGSVYAKATCNVPAPSGGTCKAPAATTGAAAPTYAHQGRACAPAAAPGACQNGDACLPSVSGPWGLCAAHDGDVPCPNGYPQRHVVATSVTDTRACTACTCGLSAVCDNPTLVLYGDAQCGNANYKLSANQACASTNLNYVYFASWALYGAVKSAACDPSAVNPTGTVTLKNPRTVCCRP